MNWKRLRILCPQVIFVGTLATLAGMLLALQGFLRYRNEMPFQAVVYQELVSSYLWAATIPFILFITLRFPLTSRQWKRRSLLYGSVAIVVSVLHYFTQSVLYWIPHHSVEKFSFHIDTLFFFYTGWRVFIFGVLTAGCHVYFSYRLLWSEELRAARLQKELEKAALLKLQVQIDPGYVFTFFDEIEALVDNKLRDAEIRISVLGDYLRERLEKINFAPNPQVTRREMKSSFSVLGQRNISRWVLLSALYSVIAVYFYSRQVVGHKIGPDFPSILGWFLWIPATPIVLALAKDYPIQGKSAKNIIRHSIANLFILICIGAGVLFLTWLFSGGDKDISLLIVTRINRASFAFDVIAYWTIVAVGTTIQYINKSKDESLSNARRELQLLQAQLQALQMQLHPHFIFNTLNSLSQLIYENKDSAKQMLKRLRIFLQSTLAARGIEEVKLSQEIVFLKHYLAIQQTRFEGRLNVFVECDDSVLGCYVPSLILQPFVENSVRHGIERTKEGGVIRISAEKQNGQLKLQVQDNGPGTQFGQILPGLGFEITKNRLNHLYGPSYNLSVKNELAGGFTVTLFIPALFEPRFGKDE